MNGCAGCVLDTCLQRSYYGPPFKSLQYNLEDRTSMSSEEQHRTMGNNWESQAGRRAQNRRPSSFSSWLWALTLLSLAVRWSDYMQSDLIGSPRGGALQPKEPGRPGRMRQCPVLGGRASVVKPRHWV